MIDLTWYHTLTKPMFAPPSGVFTPAWVFLYVLIIVSLLIYITAKSKN